MSVLGIRCEPEAVDPSGCGHRWGHSSRGGYATGDGADGRDLTHELVRANAIPRRPVSQKVLAQTLRKPLIATACSPAP
jgi:hypothetical protein